MNALEKNHHFKKPLVSAKEWIVGIVVISLVSFFSMHQVFKRSVEFNHEQQKKIFSDLELDQRKVVSYHAKRLFLKIPDLEMEDLNSGETEIVRKFSERTGFYTEFVGSTTNKFDLPSLAKSIIVHSFSDNHINALNDQVVLLHALLTKIELMMVGSKFAEQIIILDDQVNTIAKPIVATISKNSVDMIDLTAMRNTVIGLIATAKYEILNFNKGK
jgi:hypothetical protein